MDWRSDPSNQGYIEEASKIKAALISNKNFMTCGRRNDDTVDLMIACHVLGEDAKELAHQHKNLAATTAYSRIEFDNKYDVVLPYLSEWGPNGKEYMALSYTVRSYNK